jgi:Putative binding domain, N-terminal/Viral BACON domain
MACRGIVRSTRVALAALVVLISAAATSAQTVVDPTVVEFIPSADHDALTADGEAVVQSYSLSIFQADTRTLLQTVNLGKPTPDTDGKIRTPFPTFLKPAPLPGVVYEARVAAVGISKTSASAFSNTFSFSGTCGASLTPVSQTFTASGGSGSVNVKIAIGCPWTAVSSAAWLTITGGASGSESGTVTFTVAANTSTTARSATLTIAGQIFTVTQAGAAACAYAISPASKSMPKAGGTGSFSVTTTAGCAWTASSDASWLTVTGTATGSGSGTVTYSVAASTATTERTGTITVGGQIFRVTQAAGASCTYTVSPLSLSVPPGGGSASVAITTADGCAWGSFTSASWITLTGTTSDSGTGALTFTAAANTTTATRIGAITLAGQTVAVSQAPVPSSCSYVISPTSRSVPVSGTSGVLSVTATAGCTWSATSSAAWLGVTDGSSGSGNGAVSYIVDANTSPTPRSATITVGGQTFTVNQNGTAGCITGLSPTTQAFGSLGGSNWVTVTALAGCGWTAASNKTWITVVAGSSGTGSGTVSYSVAANTGGARSGTITIGGLTTTISQAAAACTYSVTPTSVSPPAAGATGTITVTAGSGCTWGSFSSTPWITVSGGATGSGSATYTVAPNTTGASRSGTILVAGRTISFTQGP